MQHNTLSPCPAPALPTFVTRLLPCRFSVLTWMGGGAPLRSTFCCPRRTRILRGGGGEMHTGRAGVVRQLEGG